MNIQKFNADLREKAKSKQAKAALIVRDLGKNFIRVSRVADYELADQLNSEADTLLAQIRQ